MRRATPGNSLEYSAFSAIVLLDGLGRHEERDRLVRLILAQDRDHVYTTLCEQLARPARPAGPADTPRPTLTELELRFSHTLDVDSGAPDERRLVHRQAAAAAERTDQGIEWLKLAASSPATSKRSCTLATAELNRLGIPIPPRRKRELAPEPEEAERKLHLLVRAMAADSPAGRRRRGQRALMTITPTRPGLADLRQPLPPRGTEWRRPSPAIRSCCGWSRTDPWILVRRGRAAIRAGRWSEAVADYEAAGHFTGVPRGRTQPWPGSAPPRPTPPFRDGAAALKHVESMLRATATIPTTGERSSRRQPWRRRATSTERRN